MAKLPTRDDLGPLPSVRTGRATPDIRIATPDISVATKAKVQSARDVGQAQVDAANLLGRTRENIARAYAKSADVMERGTSKLAQGLAVASDNIATMVERRKEEEDTIALLRADATLKLNSAKRRRRLFTEDPDYKTWGEKHSTETAPEIDQAVATISDPVAAKKFRIKAELEAGLDNEQIQAEAFKRDRMAKVSDLQETLDTLGDRYVIARDDNEREQILNEYKRNIDAAVSLGLINDIDGLKFVKKSREFIEADAKIHKAQNPKEFLRAVTERGGRAFDIIRQVEGTTDNDARRAGFASGYDVPLGYGKWGLPPRPLTEMTLAEVKAFGLEMRRAQAATGVPWEDTSSAAGAFQIVGTTMEDYMAEAGLTWDDKFTPENQHKLAAVILKHQGFDAWAGFKRYAGAKEEAEAAINQPSGRYQGLDEVTRAELVAETVKDMTTVGTIYEARDWEAKNLPAIPTDGDVKKRFSAFASEEKWVEGLINKNMDVVDNNIIPRIAKYGIVPEEVKGSISGLLASNNENSVIFGLTVMDKVQKAHPGAFNRDTNDEMVETLARYRVSGQYQKPEEFAAELIEERSSPAKTAARETLTKDGKAKAEKLAPYLAGYFYEGPLSGNVGKQEILPRQIRGALGPAITQNPAEWEEVQQEFISLYSAAYEKYGSHDKAMPAAMAVLKRSWYVSQATGEGRIMRWAPEMFSPEGVDPAWIQLQARARLYPLIGDGSFILETDDRTDTEVKSGKLPTWLVSVPAASAKTKTAAEEGYKIAKMKADATGAK